MLYGVLDVFRPLLRHFLYYLLYLRSIYSIIHNSILSIQISMGIERIKPLYKLCCACIFSFSGTWDYLQGCFVSH